MSSDDCSSYDEVLLNQYGETVVPPRTNKAGRPAKPFKQWPANSVYVTVKKTYEKGKVSSARRSLVHGTEEDLAKALEVSKHSKTINTAFVERQNGTDRTYNARKARKTYEFSKDIVVHLAVTWWVMFCYNFHHLHRSLLQRLDGGKLLHRTPAMAASLQSYPLTVAEIATAQVVGFAPPRRGNAATTSDFGYRRCNRASPDAGPAP